VSKELENFEEDQQDLNPHRREEQQRAATEAAARLSRRGISLTGNESPDELADLLSAVETFEQTVQRRGGDLMVDDLRSSQPDDPHFALPRRESGEEVCNYIRRLDQAVEQLRHHPAHPD